MVKLKQLASGLGTAVLLSVSASAFADPTPIYTQNFSGVNAATTAASLGLIDLNRSTLPKTNWGPGSTAVLNAQAGAATSYFANSYEASGAVDLGQPGTISDWLITPLLTLANNYTFTFFARGVVDATLPTFTDNLQLRLCAGSAACTALSSASTTTDAALVTLFTPILLNINPTYSSTIAFENDWTQYTATVSGLGFGNFSGRFALRYVIDDVTTHGNYVGIDSIVVSAVPEPESVLLLAVGLTAMGVGLRRRTRK